MYVLATYLLMATDDEAEDEAEHENENEKG